MTRRVFRIFSAFTMLLLYVSVLAVDSGVALTCRCSHHKADVHTAFDHVHACNHHSCDERACENEHGMRIADKTCCNHNHSNSILLYTQSRAADADHAERQAMLLAVVTDVLNFVEAEQMPDVSSEYGLYLISLLSAGHASGSSLRAPPVFA